MNTTIRTIICAAAVVMASVSCQKSVEPVQTAEEGKGTIDICVNGLMGEYSKNMKDRYCHHFCRARLINSHTERNEVRSSLMLVKNELQDNLSYIEIADSMLARYSAAAEFLLAAH